MKQTALSVHFEQMFALFESDITAQKSEISEYFWPVFSGQMTLEQHEQWLLQQLRAEASQ